MKKILIPFVAIAFVITSCTPKTTTAVEGSEMSKSQKIAEGKTIFENSCAKCHDLPDPKSHNDGQWIGIVNVMAKKAKLTDEQGTMVYDYITSQN